MLPVTTTGGAPRPQGNFVPESWEFWIGVATALGAGIAAAAAVGATYYARLHIHQERQRRRPFFELRASIGTQLGMVEFELHCENHDQRRLRVSHIELPPQPDRYYFNRTDPEQSNRLLAEKTLPADDWREVAPLSAQRWKFIVHNSGAPDQQWDPLHLKVYLHNLSPDVGAGPYEAAFEFQWRQQISIPASSPRGPLDGLRPTPRRDANT
jgi:hypothetical protein